ncbi:sensor histidine kinase [Hymenobacter canadensis]|uniref:Histidine kinase n=1 Tax=Hymenobacter canadensis TaxID=2999067 RepID=A0ABY7LX20_9BACT|nr:histidine kinase [Hymenobacter canadensis]WBA44139.1 histidine kinase [Hymenobacter canadensis]
MPQHSAPPAARPLNTAMISPQQYLRIAFLTGVILAVLGLPGLLRRPEVTPALVVAQFVQVLVFTDVLLGLNYFLRYSNSPVQRWLRRLPLRGSQALRVLLNLLLASLLGPLLRTAMVRLGYGVEDTSWPLLLVSSWLLTFIILVIQYFIEVTERSRRLLQENELLKREQLQARYEGLKQQLSPHFLFNSLATLRWLIHDDPNAAEQFVEEMSQVYRYLLQYGEQDAVPLRDEMAFLRSYVFLLRMRFGESLQLDAELPEQVLDRLVPPLALQTLVENAVKHNAVSRQHPLRITVALGVPDCLLVRNSRRARLTPEPSSGVGLRNLANRVRILHQQELQIEQSADEFSVCLPLPPMLVGEGVS